MFPFILVDCIAHAGPIAIYPLNSQYTTQEIDNLQPTGNAKGLSLADGPCDQPDGSYQFHGSNDSYITFPNNGSLDVQHSITMLCWVYFSNPTSGPFFVYYNKTDIAQFFGMGTTDGMLVAHFSHQSTISTENILELGQWYYMGASYDHVSRNASLWVNGIKVAQKNFDTNITLANGFDVRMGAGFSSGKYFNRFDFHGRITAMQVYDYSLNGEQIDSVKYATFGTGKFVYALFHLFDFLA